MSHKKAERISMGEQIYKHEITKREAMDKYGIGKSTAELYVRENKKANGIPIKTPSLAPSSDEVRVLRSKLPNSPEISEYMAMSKEELIREMKRRSILLRKMNGVLRDLTIISRMQNLLQSPNYVKLLPK